MYNNEYSLLDDVDVELTHSDDLLLRNRIEDQQHVVTIPTCTTIDYLLYITPFIHPTTFNKLVVHDTVNFQPEVIRSRWNSVDESDPETNTEGLEGECTVLPSQPLPWTWEEEIYKVRFNNNNDINK